ncbi:MAG: response regulator [Terriglobia bacterium]
MPRILLVEDHRSLAALRCAVLRGQKYAVVLTADGREACRLLESEPFDLVITDSELPSGSGWEVARAAKKRRLPVILSTGWPLGSRRSRDVDYVLAKPSTMTRFLTLIHTALQKTKSPAPELTPARYRFSK